MVVVSYLFLYLNTDAVLILLECLGIFVTIGIYVLNTRLGYLLQMLTDSGIDSISHFHR